MNAYESGNAAYFATPPVNLIYAFHAALTAITKSSPSLPERFKLHRAASARVKAAAAELGLKQLPLDPAYAANGKTAVGLPSTLTRASYSLAPIFHFDSCTSLRASQQRTSSRAWVRRA